MRIHNLHFCSTQQIPLLKEQSSVQGNWSSLIDGVGLALGTHAGNHGKSFVARLADLSNRELRETILGGILLKRKLAASRSNEGDPPLFAHPVNA